MKTKRQSTALFTKAKVTVTAFLLLFMVQSSFAQKSNFTIKAGLNESEVSLDDFAPFYNKGSRLGVSIFAAYDFYTNKYLALGIESGFLQKGFKYKTVTFEESEEVNTDGSISTAFNYIDLSLNLKFIARQKLVSPYFSITPTAGFYLGYSQNVEGTAYDSIYTATDKIIFDSLNSVSFGIKFGVGAEFNKLIKNVPVVFEIRFNPDLTYDYDKYSIKLKNKVVEFNLGLKF